MPIEEAFEVAHDSRPPVARSLNDLDGLADRLAKQVDLLRERLSLVLGPSVPSEAQKRLEPVRDSGPLAAALNDLHERIDTSYALLQGLMSRLEI